MKKISFIIIIALLFLLIACDNTFFNYTGVFVSEIRVINLPEDMTVAATGPINTIELENDDVEGLVVWDNTLHATTSINKIAIIKYDPPLEIAAGKGNFKIVESGTWESPYDGIMKNAWEDADIFKIDGFVSDGDSYILIWDASKPLDSLLTFEKTE